MQVTFDFGQSAILVSARDRVRAAIGPIRDEGRHDPVSQLIKSILSSRTRDEVSGPAFYRLNDAYPAWDALADIVPQTIEAIVDSVEFADKKAVCIHEMLKRIRDREGRLCLDFLDALPVDGALLWLEDQKGIGRKISAATLNFSTMRRKAFVLDTHVLRALARLGLLPSSCAEDADKAYSVVMPSLMSWSADALYEFHWLLKRLGQTICTYNDPKCRICPLRALCPRKIAKGRSATR
jgi:endonuclease-3